MIESSAPTAPTAVVAPAGRRRSPPRRPRCALVGAGPGDPGLLTLRALQVMRRATLLLVDDLVSDEVLALARRGRRRAPRVVHVGKRGGCTSTPQDFIERLLVHEALAGEFVVRLKGGDPFVFGRGGEEAEALMRHGIEVEVVHGITAGLAAAGALGVPWTHRAHAHGVMLVTGHPGDGVPSPDWAVLAAAAAQGLTLVIYMGMARLDAIVAGLTERLPADTPAAIVMGAATPAQRELLAPLARLPAASRAAGLGSPAIVIVGDVLRVRDGLAAEAPSRPAPGRARAA